MKLYKFRTFNTYTADLLTSGSMYYADPNAFNDPLETVWQINNDMDVSTAILVLKAVNKKSNHIKDLDGWLRDNKNTVAYWASESVEDGDLSQEHQKEYEEGEFERLVLSEIQHGIERVLLIRGVLSLSGRWDSVLMWSHYADEHKGICIEYTCDPRLKPSPKDVFYTGNRSILLSVVHEAYIQKSASAIDEIFDVYYFTKSKEWHYEQEKRLLNQSPGYSGEYYINLTGIYFGLRCPKSTISMIASAMQQRTRVPEFYQVRASIQNMELTAHKLDEQAIYYFRPADGFPFPPLETD